MIVYVFDNTLDGLLTAVFDNFFRKQQDVTLLAEGEQLPLFADEPHHVITDSEKAMRVLKSRLYELYSSQAHEAEAEARKAQVGSGDRSMKIRTYNFPQSRVTDHRIGLTLYKLEAFIDGDMDEMIDALILDERMKLLGAEE